MLRAYLMYTVDMTYVENIIAVYARATPDEIDNGAAWYEMAHDIALDISGGNAYQGAGVISAFSPRQQWHINIRNARNAFATGIATGHTKAMCSLAQRILDGEYAMDVLKGDKQRAFCDAIATGGKSTIATIDRHAHDIAVGHCDFTDGTRKIGKVLYREMSAAYAEAADSLAISTNQLQAITWVTWRREKGIK